MASCITIEIAYALADRQLLLAVQVVAGVTARQAVQQSGLEAHFPGLDLATAPLGMYGKLLARPEERVLQAGERVEVLRPLLADPKEARKQRAARLARDKA